MRYRLVMFLVGAGLLVSQPAYCQTTAQGAPSPSLQTASKAALLVDELKSDSPERRAQAAYDLAKLGPQAIAAVPSLKRLLIDETRLEHQTRLKGELIRMNITSPGLEAAKAIWAIQPTAFVEVLQSGADVERYHATRAVAEFAQNPEAAGYLLMALLDTNSSIRSLAGKGLHYSPSPAASEPLRVALRHKRHDVRALAVGAMVERREPDALEHLARVLKTDPHHVPRSYAAYYLGVLQDQRAVESLELALGDTSPRVRLHAVMALGQLKRERGFGALRNMKPDSSERVQRQVAETLQDAMLVTELRKQFVFWREMDATSRVRLLSDIQFHADAFIDELLIALRDESQHVCDKAIYVLGKISSPEDKVTSALAVKLRNCSAPYQQEDICDLLANFGGGEALAGLQGFLFHEDVPHHQRAYAARALAKLHTPDALKTLEIAKVGRLSASLIDGILERENMLRAKRLATPITLERRNPPPPLLFPAQPVGQAITHLQWPGE